MSWFDEDSAIMRCECVFDMTTVACRILQLHPEISEAGYDSRALFGNIFSWSFEFENGVLDEDNGDYMDQIEEFAYKKLTEYFGIEK